MAIPPDPGPSKPISSQPQPVPGPSKRAPYSPRRPQRYASLVAGKQARKAKYSSNEVSEPLPSPGDLAGGIASALPLPSQSKSTTYTRSQRHLDELSRVAEAMKPSSSKRGVDPLDDILLSGREVPGARRSYRLHQPILIDYGNEWDDLIVDNRLVTMDFLNELYKCTTLCYKCDHIIKFEEVGFGAASTIISKCTNEYCDFDNTFKDYPRKLNNNYTANLSVTLETILQDSGFVGFVNGNQARGLPVICKDSFYNHAKEIYKLMDGFYDKNIVKVHDDIKSFFKIYRTNI